MSIKPDIFTPTRIPPYSDGTKPIILDLDFARNYLMSDTKTQNQFYPEIEPQIVSVLKDIECIKHVELTTEYENMYKIEIIFYKNSNTAMILWELMSRSIYEWANGGQSPRNKSYNTPENYLTYSHFVLKESR